MTQQQISELKKQLPHNWRQRVVQILADQKVSTNADQIYNVLRGKVVDKDLTLQVLKAIAKVKRRHRFEQQKINGLKKELIEA